MGSPADKYRNYWTHLSILDIECVARVLRFIAAAQSGLPLDDADAANADHAVRRLAFRLDEELGAADRRIGRVVQAKRRADEANRKLSRLLDEAAGRS